MKLTIDFETRSAAPLRECGAWRYAQHPTTEIFCLAVKEDEEKTGIWISPYFLNILQDAFEPMRYLGLILYNSEDLRHALSKATEIEAHNAEFERAIMKHVATVKFPEAFPEIPLEKWRCSAAKVAAHSLPRRLEDAAKVLGVTHTKDMAGYQVMMKMCKPQKPTKANGGKIWHEDPEDLLKLFRYCISDVDSEHDVSSKLRGLSDSEQKLWFLDQKINERGIYVDTEASAAIVDMIEKDKNRIKDECLDLTDFEIESPTQAIKVLNWLEKNHKIKMPNMQKETVEKALSIKDLPEDARKMLALRQQISKSSVGKFKAIMNRAGEHEDQPEYNYIQGSTMFHAASTGRWGGKGLQPHNMPKARYKDVDPDRVIELIKEVASGEQDTEFLELMYDNPYTCASKLTRAMITAPPGCQLVCADYSGIEMVVLAWMAGSESRLEAIREGVDLYKVAASDTYDVAYEDVTSEQRNVGKVEELAFGYQGGWSAFKTFATKFKIEPPAELSLDLEDPDDVYGDDGVKMQPKTALYRKWARPIVKTWRQNNPEILKLWYGLDETIFKAVESGKPKKLKNLSFMVKDKFLWILLPSGRLLAYFDPKIENVKMRWRKKLLDDKGEPIIDKKSGKQKTEAVHKDAVTYWGVDGTTKQWVKKTGYGGLWTENCISGDAKILTPAGWLRLDSYKEGMQVWDGEEFVYGGKLLDRGYKPVIEYTAVQLTPDHKILCDDDKWRTAYEITSQCERFNRKSVWTPFDHIPEQFQEWPLILERNLRLRKYRSSLWKRDDKKKRSWSQVLRVLAKGFTVKTDENSRDVQSPGVRGVEVDAIPMPHKDTQSISQLRRTWDICVQKLERLFPKFCRRHVTYLRKRVVTGQKGQQQRVFKRELQMGVYARAKQQQKKQCLHKNQVGAEDHSRSVETLRDKHLHHYVSDSEGLARARAVTETRLPKQARVFDIQNCGPRNRFVVKGDSEPFIVHNCVQAIARDILAHGMFNVEKRGFKINMHVHDEILAPVLNKYANEKTLNILIDAMTDLPYWAKGCPITAAGWVGKRYRKD